jgi:outer membrane immunogenic protein
MRKLILLLATLVSSGSAFAADLPLKAPPPAVPPSFSWTGFYIGANGGYGWQDPTALFTGNDFLSNGLTCGGTLGGTCVPPISFGISGVFGGLQGGYNWQVNQRWVLGVEADFDWSRIRGTGSANVPLTGLSPINFQASQNITGFGTARGVSAFCRRTGC